MLRTLLIVTVSTLLLTVPVLGQTLPQVLQPDAPTYSASQQATLAQAITSLQQALNQSPLASQRYFSPTEWGSQDFAGYTAGILAGIGYQTTLVSGAGWPEGTHVWILVQVDLGQQTAWIPVEASPTAGHSQQVLGHVPTTTSTGNLRYDPRYLSFDSVVELPENIPPVAKIRPPAFAVLPGESARLLAPGSYDQDGKIVLYRWNFGDGSTRTYTSWVARHTFIKVGTYTVILTVIDNRGTQSSTKLSIQVVLPGKQEKSSATSSGCGCGK